MFIQHIPTHTHTHRVILKQTKGKKNNKIKKGCYHPTGSQGICFIDAFIHNFSLFFALYLVSNVYMYKNLIYKLIYIYTTLIRCVCGFFYFLFVLKPIYNFAKYLRFIWCI